MAASMLHVDLTRGGTPIQQQLEEAGDNCNLSPGMDAWVFTVDDDEHDDDDNQDNNNSNTGNRPVRLRLERKVWGLVTRAGTVDRPVEPGMGKHFANLMFNARADTLSERPTFARLLRSRRTCLIAVDGFFEWKSETGGVKQPYFVSVPPTTPTADDDDTATTTTAATTAAAAAVAPSFMLLAGLWTSVATGRTADDGSAAEQRLDTFTIITTEACESLRWLHSRMPLTVTDASWLQQCQRLPCNNELLSSSTSPPPPPPPVFRWHAVTRDMTSLKFRSAAAIQPLPKLKTVKSMFAAAAASAPMTPTTTTPKSSSTDSTTTTTKKVPAADAATTTTASSIVDGAHALSSSSKKKKRIASTSTTPSPRQVKRGKKNAVVVGSSDDETKRKTTTTTRATIDSFFKPKPTSKHNG
jgi:putative SOS response-associated peptidase YedK